MAPRHALQFADESEVLSNLHFRVKRGRFRKVADAPLHFHGLLEDVEAGHVGGAIGGRKKAGEDAHGGGFPGAVGAQETHDLPLLNFKRDVIHRDSAGVSLREVLNRNHR